MGAAGSPYAAFKRALAARNVTLALADARDMSKLNLPDSLRLLVLIGEEKPDLYERAAVRGAGRYLLERRGVALAEAQLVLAALAGNDDRGRALLDSLARERRGSQLEARRGK